MSNYNTALFNTLVNALGETKATEIWNDAQDDYGCAIFTSIEVAVKENLIENDIDISFLNTNVDEKIKKEVEINDEVKVIEEVKKEIEEGENLVKPSIVETVNQTNTKEESMSYTEFLADMLFTSGKCLRTDISAEAKAKKEAAAAERRAKFVNAFADKLVAPSENVLLVEKRKNGKGAIAKVGSKLAKYFNAFDLKGIDNEGNPAEVKFNKETLEACEQDQEGYVLQNGYEFFARGLAQATEKLTALEKAQFFSLAYKGVGRSFKVTSDSVIMHDVEFDFEQGRVHTKTQIKEVNPIFELDGVEFEGKHSVFLLALTAYGKSDRAVNTLVNNAVNLFKRDENYGTKTVKGDMAHSVYHNFNLPVKVTKAYSNKFPFISLGSAKLDDGKLKEVLSKGGMAIVDKYNMKWLASGVAAEAVGVGRNGDTIINLNDANKPTKVYNRPASNKYLFANVEGRTNSHFAISLSNGESAYSAGKKLRSVFANSRFGHGSGVSVINPEFGFNYTVSKSLKSVFNILTLPAAMRVGKKYEEVTAAICSKINALIFNVIGNSFAPSESILELSLADTSKTILSNDNKAVDLKVTGGKAVITSAYEIDIKLDVEIVGTHEQFVKLRGMGKKATTLPYSVEGIDAPWDILLNIEAVKGWPALIEMYCNEFGIDCFYNSNTGILTTPEGEVDFKQSENAFTKWASETAKETVISFEMARSCYEDHKAVINGFDDVEVVDNGNVNCVLIKERIQYIIGDICFDVEVSTPKESVSSTEFTLEAVSGVLLQDKELGEALMQELTTKVESTTSLVNSFMTIGKLPSFDVMTQEGRNGISSVIKSHDGFADHKEVLKNLCVAFPRGFEVTFSNGKQSSSFEVHPRALATFGGFTGNGSATREIAQVIDFVYYITDAIQGESGVDSVILDMCYRTSTTLANWAENLVQSKSAMKKFTRSGNLVGGKVRTTYSPSCNNVNGLPVVVVNPNGPMARMLKLDRSIIFGQIVGLTRTPMPFMTAAYVRLDNECPIGHVLVSPKVWHAANEGDSDGDGIALLNLSKYGVDLERARNINLSLMGPAGYDFMYGADVPAYEFCSHEDKWGKKSLTVWNKPIAHLMSVEAYGEGAIQVSQHYKFNVGTSYAMCSQLVFAAANGIYTNSSKEEQDTLVKACVVAWRGIYEGLGLSGYTPAAHEFFQLLRFGAYSYTDGKILQVDGELTYGFAKTTKDQDVKEVNAFVMMSKHFPQLEIEVLQRLLKSRAVGITYRKIENKGVASIHPKSCLHALIPAAIICGTLRRLGQGNDPVEVSLDFDTIGDGSDTPDSLFGLFVDGNMGSMLGNKILAKVAARGALLHNVVALELADRAMNELI